VVLEAVVNAMDDTHRSSSLVENLNGRLRNYFFCAVTWVKAIWIYFDSS
jgi:hypothetical protein